MNELQEAWKEEYGGDDAAVADSQAVVERGMARVPYNLVIKEESQAILVISAVQQRKEFAARLVAQATKLAAVADRDADNIWDHFEHQLRNFVSIHLTGKAKSMKIATGFGGLGVLLTSVVLLYPHLRIYLIPLLIVLSVIGFAAYGARSLKELRRRAQLQQERAELRLRREKARGRLHALRDELLALGIDPDASLRSLAQLSILDAVPALVSHDPSRPWPLSEDPRPLRQIILFSPENTYATAIPLDRVRPFIPAAPDM